MQITDVLAAFTKKGKIVPRIFSYDSKLHKVSKINLSYEKQEGRNRQLVFHVTDENDDWTLIFDPQKLSWQIQNDSFGI